MSEWKWNFNRTAHKIITSWRLPTYGFQTKKERQTNSNNNSAQNELYYTNTFEAYLLDKSRRNNIKIMNMNV